MSNNNSWLRLPRTTTFSLVMSKFGKAWDAIEGKKKMARLTIVQLQTLLNLVPSIFA